ncbi:MAG: hypothetical protein WEB04_07615, partial [Dehalococcoidia bacterium]
MHVRPVLVVFTAVAVLGLAAAAPHADRAHALPAQAVIYEDPAAANIFLGAPPLVIPVRVQAVPPGQGVGAFQLHIVYDPDIVTVQIEQGPFLTSMGGTAFCINQPVEGATYFGCVSIDNGAGPTGAGVLANITVVPAAGTQLRAAPQNFIEVLLSQVTGDTALSDTLGLPIPLAAITNSRIAVRALEGDVNVDCVVNIADIDAVSSRLGAEDGSLAYSTIYDLEPSTAPDGDIDTADVQVVSGRNGSTCQTPHPAQPPPSPPCSDADGDLICNPGDLDDDNDGMSDAYEVAQACLDPLAPDSSSDPDLDTLSSGVEALIGTNACLFDTDGDALPDPYEVAYGCLSPLVPDADADPDSDAYASGAEFGAGTDPCVADTDSDALFDGAEAGTYFTNPLDADSDDDGLSDGDEVTSLGTNPLDADSDDDGLSDGDEVTTHATNPLDADSDDDGLSDGDE